MNVKSIARYTGISLLVYSALMLGCLIVSVINEDSAMVAFLLSFLLTAITGAFPLIFVRKSGRLSAKDAAILLLILLLTSAVFGILPYLVWIGGNLLPQTTVPVSLLFWKASIHLFLLVALTACMVAMSRSRVTVHQIHHKIG